MNDHMVTKIQPKTDRDLEMWLAGATAERETLASHIGDLEPAPGNADLQRGFREGVAAALELLRSLDG